VRCQRLRATAHSKSDTIGAARLEAQAFRQPALGALVLPGDVPARLEQVRAGISWSPIDMWRGEHLVAAADWECIAEGLRERLLEIVDQGERYGRAVALRRGIAAFDVALVQATRTLSESEERQRRGIDTLFETDALRSRVVAMRTEREQLRAEAAALEAAAPEVVAGPLAPLLDEYESASLEAERARSRERSLESWRADVRVGAVPWPKTDWFGALSVGWSTGAVAQAKEERRAVDGRARELSEAVDEIRHRLTVFETALRQSMPALEAELAVIREHLADLRHRVETTPPEDDYRKVIDASRLEIWAFEARAELVEALVATRRALLEGRPS
jgi:hypothetical protein